MSVSSRNAILWSIAACAAFFALHSMLLAPGVPSFRHDWFWPFDARQIRAGVLMDLAPWQPAGLGGPNPLPINHPVYWLWYIGSYIVAPAQIIKATLFVAFMLFAAGVSFCAARIAKPGIWVSAVCGVTALLGPPLLNKLVAGHVNYLIALAFLPWELYFALSTRRRDLVAAGIFAALTVIQIQLFCIAEIVLICAAGAAVRRRQTPAAAGALALSLVLFAPAFLGIASGTVASGFAQAQTIMHWELNNSAPFPAAIVGFGYFARYAGTAYAASLWGAIASWVLWIVPLLAAIGFFRRRDGASALLAFAFVILELLVLGMRGPAAPILSYAFRSSLAFSVARELYHFEAPAWTALCLLAASGIALIPRRTAVLACALAVFATAAGWAPAHYAGQLFNAVPPAGRGATLESLADKPGDWSVLLLPAETPLGQRQSAGADPYAYPLGRHPSLNAYRLFGPAEAAASFGDSAAQDAWAYRHLAGIGAVISRPELHADISGRYEPPKHVPAWMASILKHASARPVVPHTIQVQPTCTLCAYNAMPVLKSMSEWQFTPVFVRARDDASAASGNVADVIEPTASQQSDPSIAWVSKRYWEFLDPRIAMAPAGVLTWSSAPLRLPSASVPLVVHVLLLHGSVTAGGKRLQIPLGRSVWARLPCTRCSLRVIDGLAVVEGFLRSNVYSPAVSAPQPSNLHESRLRYDWRALSGGGDVPAGTHWIVLKQRFTPAFTLSVTGGRVVRHLQVDGYASGWEIRGSGPMHVQVRYAGALAICAMQWTGAILLVAAGLLTLFSQTVVVGRQRLPMRGFPTPPIE